MGLRQIPVKLKFKDLRRHRCQLGTLASALFELPSIAPSKGWKFGIGQAEAVQFDMGHCDTCEKVVPGKAPEGWSSPRRSAFLGNRRVARSVLDCGSPLPLSQRNGQ